MRRVLLLLCLLGCDAGDAPPGETRTYVDVRGKSVRFAWPPKRIVSIVPSSTELLFAAGAGDQVVGVTDYCLYPPEAKSRAKVGGQVLNMERLISLRPDLIVTTARLTQQNVRDLEERGLAVYSVDPMSFEEIAAALRTIGEITGHPEEGVRAADALSARVAAVALEGEGPTFYFEHSAEPLGTTGPESYAGDALRRAGGRNVFSGGWHLIEWESVLAADPDMILFSHDSRAGFEHRAGWEDLRAVKNGRVHHVAKEGLLFPTPRLVDGLEAAHRIFAGGKR